MEQVPRYSTPAPHVLRTTVGQTDLSSLSTPDLRDLSSLAGALQARAEQEISARKPPFPSSLPPQLVISWLPLRDVASALCVSSAWHGTSAAVFQIVAQSRGLGRERADIPWSEVVRYSMKRVTVISPGKLYSTYTDLATWLGVYDQGWVHGLGAEIGEPLLVGDTGDFIAEIESPIHAVAFRADRTDGIYCLGRRGVVVGYPGEFSPLALTPAQVKTFRVSELKRQLAGRGLSTEGLKADLKERLLEALRIQDEAIVRYN